MRLKLFLIGLILMLIGCETDIAEKAKLEFSTEEFNTVFVVDVLDSKTNEIIDVQDYPGLNEINLTITSEETMTINGTVHNQADLWTDLAYSPKSSFTGSIASFVFALSLNAPEITESNQINISLKADFVTDGNLNLLSASKIINISDDGVYHIAIYTMNTDNPAPGVVYVTDDSGVTNSNGELIESVIVGDETLGAIVTIPAGAILKDGDNQPIEGKVNSVVGLFNNQSDESPSKDNGSLTSIPGDLTLQNGDQMIVGGAVSINMYETEGDGDQMMTLGGVFSSITFVIPNNLYNPITQAPIAVGDEISICYFNSVLGIWTSYLTTYVQELSGVKYVDFIITQSGYYSPAILVPLNNLETPQINVHGNTFTHGELLFKVQCPGYIQEFFHEATNNQAFTMPIEVPSLMPFIVSVYIPTFPTAPIASTQPSIPLSNETIIDLDIGDLVFGEVEFNLTGICDNQDIKIRPSGVPVYVAKFNNYDNPNDPSTLGPKVFAGITIDGTIIASNINRIDSYYRFYISYEDINAYADIHFIDGDVIFMEFNDYIKSKTVDGSIVKIEFTAPEDICSEF